MDECTLQFKMRERGIDLVTAETIEEKALLFDRALRMVIPPKDISDNVTFRNISNWLVKECKACRFDEHSIFRRVLDFALEASGPKSRVPAAVFMSILKKELGYHGAAKNAGE